MDKDISLKGMQVGKNNVKEVLVYKNYRWQKAIGYVKGNKWIEFIRPEIQVLDDVTNISGMTVLNDNTLRDNGIKFGSEGSISIWQINDNFVTLDNIDTGRSDYSDLSQFKSKGEVIFSTGTAKFGGIYLNFKNLQPGKKYTLSFNYDVLEGNFLSFGGHTDLSYATNTCYLNGEDTGLGFASWLAIYNPNSKTNNEVKVIFDIKDNYNASDTLHIQPNRGYNDAIKVRLEKLKFEVGDKVTYWNYVE